MRWISVAQEPLITRDAWIEYSLVVVSDEDGYFLMGWLE